MIKRTVVNAKILKIEFESLSDIFLAIELHFFEAQKRLSNEKMLIVFLTCM